MPEIKIEVEPVEETAGEVAEVSAVDVAEVQAIVADAIEDAEQEAELEQAADKIAELETVVKLLDEKVQDLETAVVSVEADIQDDEMRDAENQAEHEILQLEVSGLAAEEIKDEAAEEAAEVSGVSDDVAPPHAEQHILFAPGKTVFEKFKAWYNA